MTNNLVILHGWASKIQRWHKIRPQLEKQGFKVFLPSLPGFGENKLVKPWKLDDYIDWLEQYLADQKLDQYILLGHSFGGSLGIKLASQRPKGLEKLILVNSSGIRKRFTLKKLFFLILAKTGKLFFLIPPLCFFKKPATQLLYIFVREKDYFKANPVMKKTLHQVVNQDLTGVLKRIKTPTLILWGKNDKETPLIQGQLINQKIAQSKLIVLDTTHGLPFKKTKELVKNVKEFLV